MDDYFNRFIVEPFRDFLDVLLRFLPNMLVSVLILVSGVLISLIVRFVLQKLLAAFGLDKYSEKAGINDLLKKGGVTDTASALLARLVFWLVLIMFLIISLETINLPEVDQLLGQFFLYLPSIFASVVIVFIGYVLSNFLAKTALVWSVNAGIKRAGLLSKAVKLAVMLLTLTMALEQLSIGRSTIIIVFAIIFGGGVLALSIAFGLGGKDLAREFLESRMKEAEEQKDEINHL